MIIDDQLLDALSEKAKATPRLRMNFDLRNAESDQSQRMHNAIEPGSLIPVHRQNKTSETRAILRGLLKGVLYDISGLVVIEEVILDPSGPVFAMSVPKGQWHTWISLASGTVILEMKDGPYEPLGPDEIME